MSFAPVRNAFQEWTAPYTHQDPFSAGWKRGGEWMKPTTDLLSMDLIETAKDYQIIADAPGVEPGDVEVQLHEYTITIKADRKNSYETNVDKAHLIERSFGTIYRNVQLPKNADIEHSNITFKNGLLRVVFPKLTEEAPLERKKLDITHE